MYLDDFKPKVTIVIPVFNGENYLREAIDSALQQTYQHIEIIVVNDGSQDQGATEHIALSYGDKIRYLAKENGGVASALNMAIDAMSGDYLSWLSHDDLYFPNKVQAQVDAMLLLGERNAIMYSDFGVFYDHADKLRVYRLPDTSPEDFRYMLTTTSRLNGCTLLLPKQAFDICGSFDKALRYVQDYDLWFRMASTFPFIHVPEVLVKSRSHSGQDTVNLKEAVRSEISLQLTGFAAALTDAELLRSGARSSSVARAVIANSFYLRGFNEAADKLMLEAVTQASDNSLVDRMAVRWIRWRALRLTPAYRWLRDGVKKIVRGKLRKWISF